MEITHTRPTIAIQRIMYATDFSSTAEEAGKYVLALARQFGATVEVAHAMYLDQHHDQLPEEVRHDYSRLLLKQQEFRAAGINAFFAESNDGPLYRALSVLEQQFKPDLIVAGTTSKPTLERLLLGSTAEHLIRESPCPVLTVGPNSRPPKESPVVFEHILFAADFTGNSEAAADLALAFAETSGAHLWVAHVTRDRPEDLTLADGLAERSFRRKLQDLIPKQAYDWCSPDFAIEHDSPAHGIVALANRIHADLIVMGARARSFWLEHLQRGVTQDVLTEAPCPVLTAR